MFIKLWIIFNVIAIFIIINYFGNLISLIYAQTEYQINITKGASIINNTEFFKPSQILIKPNDSIKWVNLDDIPHTVTSIITFGKSDVFDSGDLKNGVDFVYTFYHPGIFDYYCTTHPFSVGKVIVR